MSKLETLVAYRRQHPVVIERLFVGVDSVGAHATVPDNQRSGRAAFCSSEGGLSVRDLDMCLNRL